MGTFFVNSAAVVAENHNAICDVRHLLLQNKINRRNVFDIVLAGEMHLYLIVAIEWKGGSSDFQRFSRYDMRITPIASDNEAVTIDLTVAPLYVIAMGIRSTALKSENPTSAAQVVRLPNGIQPLVPLNPPPGPGDSS